MGWGVRGYNIFLQDIAFYFVFLVMKRTNLHNTHMSLPPFLSKNISAWLFRLNPLEVSACLSVCVCV